jgi:hypothetical protein
LLHQTLTAPPPPAVLTVLDLAARIPGSNYRRERDIARHYTGNYAAVPAGATTNPAQAFVADPFAATLATATNYAHLAAVRRRLLKLLAASCSDVMPIEVTSVEIAARCEGRMLGAMRAALSPPAERERLRALLADAIGAKVPDAAQPLWIVSPLDGAIVEPGEDALYQARLIVTGGRSNG